MPKFLILMFGLLSFFNRANSQASFEKSEIYYLDGKYKKALNYIDQAIEENGDSAKFYSLKADISLILHEDRDEYFLLMNKAIDLEPENASLLLARAYVYKLFREYNNAILDYNRALDRASTDSLKVLVYAFRGGLYDDIRKYDLAMEDLQLGYELDSNNVILLTYLSTCHGDIGNAQESMRLLERVIAIDSLNFPAWMNLGFQSSEIGNYSDALYFYDKANTISPNSYLVLNNRGYVKLKMGDISEAKKDVLKSLKLQPSNSYAYRNLALVYLENKEKEKACENLFMAKKYGYTQNYGDDVEALITKNCK